MKAGFSGVIEAAPNAQTRMFAGRPINLSAIARNAGCSPSHLSRVFSGAVCPSLAISRSIAYSLGMTIDEFASHLDTPINRETAAA